MFTACYRGYLGFVAGTGRIFAIERRPGPHLLLQRGDAKAKLAVSEADGPAIRVYDMRSGANEPLDEVRLHGECVTAMRFNEPANVVVSADARGMLEYWDAAGYGMPQEGTITFSMKLDTDLYALARAKTTAHAIDISADGSKFVVTCTDSKIRVFRFASGRLARTFDESLEAAAEVQRGGGEQFRLDPIDYGRRVAVEKELAADLEAPRPNAVFDDSGYFLLYPTLLGIKVEHWSRGSLC